MSKLFILLFNMLGALLQGKCLCNMTKYVIPLLKLFYTDFYHYMFAHMLELEFIGFFQNEVAR